MVRKNMTMRTRSASWAQGKGRKWASHIRPATNPAAMATVRRRMMRFREGAACSVGWGSIFWPQVTCIHHGYLRLLYTRREDLETEHGEGRLALALGGHHGGTGAARVGGAVLGHSAGREPVRCHGAGRCPAWIVLDAVGRRVLVEFGAGLEPSLPALVPA